jgi:RNA processing factor Prp31
MFWYHLNFEELRCPRRRPPLELTYHLQNRTDTKKQKLQKASEQARKHKLSTEKQISITSKQKERSHKNIRKIIQEHCYCFAPDEEEEDGAG